MLDVAISNAISYDMSLSDFFAPSLLLQLRIKLTNKSITGGSGLLDFGVVFRCRLRGNDLLLCFAFLHHRGDLVADRDHHVAVRDDGGGTDDRTVAGDDFRVRGGAGGDRVERGDEAGQ